MPKSKFLRAVALCTAVLGVGAFSLAGCKKNEQEHVHQWSSYIPDGASGHHRVSLCPDHDEVSEKQEAHDTNGKDGACSKCGYGASSTVPVTGVEISGKTSVKVNGKIVLTAKVSPDDATSQSVAWSITSGADYATINGESGLLEGKAQGSVKVCATAGGVSGYYDVEVVEGGSVVSVTGVSLDKTSAELTVGKADLTLTATITPDDADDQSVSWSSSNTAAATVKNGVVHAVAAGSAIITVTTNDGNKTAQCSVTVKAGSAETGKDPSKPSDPIQTPEEPEISGPVQGGPTITKASAGELETAYVEWTAADNAKWYNVYYSPNGENDWVKLDDPLVRQYKDYFRADALGLKAGSYDMKVVPVSGADAEATQYAASATKMAVYAQDRSGYAFTGGNVPGAYKADGTLKDNAQVLYITAATAKTVTTTVNRKGKPTEAAGFQTIIDTRQDSNDETPLCFRIVGKVSLSDLDHISSSEEGLQIKGTTNITIEGVGNDGTIYGFGMLIRNTTNTEIKNLGVLNFMDDGVSVDTDNSYLWMHNLDIFYGGPGGDADQAKGDGSLDIKKSKYCTVSYNHFWDSGKCCLLDASVASSGGSNYMTYHHNWFDHSDSRHARVRNATAVHIYNNYFDGNSKYGVGTTSGSSAFVENNYFRSTSNSTKAMMIAAQGTDAKGDGTFSGETGGMIKAYGNTFDLPYKPISHKTSATDFDYYEASSRSEIVPSSVTTKAGKTYSNFDTASDMYEYSVDTAEQAKKNVTRYAGRVDGGDLKWDFNNETEDGNYAIITELKSKVVGYSASVVKIGAVPVTGGGSGSGGETGGETGGGTLPEGVTKVEFKKGTYPAGITVNGNYDSKTGYLKLESSTVVTIKLGEAKTLTIHTNTANKKIKINGAVKTTGGKGEVTVTLAANETLTIQKGDSMQLEYVLFS